ncbi:HAMP domain-containing histidine kinase [Spirosoma sp. KUDC1026]|nr:HAMP domain-containing histidine kinase [Spirosoma sp. KUDC1026]
MVNLYRNSSFIAFAPMLVLATSGLLYLNWSWLPPFVSPVPPSMRWVSLFLLALASQVLFGYALWRLVNRRQHSMVQTEILHSIVHEFQTPIAAIRMSADILDSPIARDHPARTEKYVRIIREETERLQHQVETMLSVAKADCQTLSINPEPIHVHQLLNSIAERHGNYLQLVLSDTNTHLLADRLHLTNVLHNLLDNAIKYSSAEPEISIHEQVDAKGMTLAVRDRGVGMSSSTVRQIFQPFFRHHDRNQPSIKGFGLGLSYVQRIIQAHDWRIEVKSALGSGSEFQIFIPTTSLLPAYTSASSAVMH